MSSKKLTASGEISAGMEGFALADPTCSKQGNEWRLNRTVSAGMNEP